MAAAMCSLGAQRQKVTFGGVGSGTGQIRGPHGVAVSDEGDIFVADNRNQRIQVFTLQGTFIREFPTVGIAGKYGQGYAPQRLGGSGGRVGDAPDVSQVSQIPTVLSSEQKMYPHDVALDGEGNLWVVGETKSAEFAVQYDKQGTALAQGKIDLQKTAWESGVAVDTRRNHILITQTSGGGDFRYGKIQIFRQRTDDDDRKKEKKSNETLWRTDDGSTVGQQRMKKLLYVTVDGEGNILVSDCLNHCVFVYNEDGQFQFKFGGEGSVEGRLKWPQGICTDMAGNIIVADWGNSRVEMFDKTGKFLEHITTDMGRPWAVAMATQGHLVVTNREDNRVSIFHNF